jgi:16S rRNA (cytosine1402-N4)-methyltransferase
VLELSSPDGALLGIDADPVALQAASDRLARFGARATRVEAYFDSIGTVARERGWDAVDGVLFDLGVSSPQLDVGGRGFSFSQDAPLDMRFGPGAPHTAADLVNTLGGHELRRIFSEYGEERFSGRIADRIVERRRRQRITTTADLAAIVTGAKPHRHTERIHPATRVFQALRIAVNGELERLQLALPQAVDLLRERGRLAVISFHSLEDRIVKRFMRAAARGCVCPPDVPVCVCGRLPSLRILTPRPITPSSHEVEANPRARSAKLRVAERTNALQSHTPPAGGRSGGDR